MSEIDIDSIRSDVEKTQDPRKLLELALKQAETNPEEMRRDIRLLDPTCVDTSKAITLKLGDREFKPLVAYPIYTADYIRGYRKPKLVIEYDPVSLLAHVDFQFAEKVNADAPDALELLKRFMPEDTVYNDREKWVELCAIESPKAAALLSQPELQVPTPREDLGLVLLKFGDATATAYLRRLFMFSWFYIEGAQTPDESDKTWDVFVVTDRATHQFRGYSSVYSFLYYSTAQQFEAEGAEAKLLRKRIAHFLILPPFQGSGIGKTLYLTLVRRFVADAHTKEIEVEEPSAGFEVLRDRAHYHWLTADPATKELLEQYAEEPAEALATLMQQYKMDAVQFQRVAEMHCFMENNQKETRALKKMIKSRLYKHNYADLRDMDPATQRDQLHAVYENALHMHKVALHLEEFDDNEDDEEDEEELGPAEMLLAQLAQGGAGPSALDELLQEPPKRRKLDE